MDDIKSISDAVMPVIEQRIGAAPAIFNLWFGEVELISLSDTEAVFVAPTELKKKILITKYIHQMGNALEDVIGFTVEVKIVSRDELEEVEEFIEDDDDEDDIPVPDPTEEDDGKEEIISEFISGASDKPSMLDNYTFDNFVVGSSNTFAKVRAWR